MGISCNIYLPSDTRFSDVCDVIGILLDLDKYKVSLSGGGWYCKVDGVRETFITKEEKEDDYIVFPRSNYRPGFCTIEIQNNFIDKQWHTGYYHFETSENMRCISGGYNEFWRLVGTGLVEFFGGYVDYDDCDLIDKDFEKEKPREKNNPEDGEEWDSFQQEIYNIKSLR